VCGNGTRRGGGGGRRRRGQGRFGLGLLGGDLGLLLRSLQLRAGHEELPAEQHGHAEHDGQDDVAIIFHYLGFRGPRPEDWRSSDDRGVCTRWISAPRSATSLAKGTLSASRRPTST